MNLIYSREHFIPHTEKHGDDDSDHTASQKTDEQEEKARELAARSKKFVQC